MLVCLFSPSYIHLSNLSQSFLNSVMHWAITAIKKKKKKKSITPEDLVL